jgi:hypothetical protein
MVKEIDIQNILITSRTRIIESTGIRENAKTFLDNIQSLFKPTLQSFIIKGLYRGNSYKTKIYRHHIIIEINSPVGLKKVFFSYEALTKSNISDASKKKQAFLIHFFATISNDILNKKAKTFIEDRRYTQ